MPGAGRVLVVPGPDGGDGGLGHLGRAVGVGEALAEVDRARRDGQRRHLGEDRRGEGLQVGAHRSAHGPGAYGEAPHSGGPAPVAQNLASWPRMAPSGWASVWTFT